MKSNARAALEALLRIGNVGMANAGAVLLIIVSLAGHVTAAEEDGHSVARADTSSPQATTERAGNRPSQYLRHRATSRLYPPFLERRWTSQRASV
jgi:hypothetical protein